VANSFRIGYSRDAVLNNVGAHGNQPPGKKDPNLAAIPGQFASQVVVSELTPFTGGVKAMAQASFRNSFQFYDDAFWTMEPTPEIRGGRRAKCTQYVPAQRVQRTFTFKTLQDFLLNQPQRFTAGLAANPGVGLRQGLLGFTSKTIGARAQT